MNGTALAAAALVAIVSGLLWATPSRQLQDRGERFVALLLGLDTGAVLVGGITLAAAAGRSWIVVGNPNDTFSDRAMLDVSRLDGDGDLFALLVVVIALVTLFTATIVGTAARSVTISSAGDRAVITGVLWAQVLVGLYGVGHLLLNGVGPLAVGLVLHLPLTIGALVVHHGRRPLAPAPAR